MIAHETQEISAQIRQFITANFPLARQRPILEDDAQILDSGIIDSLGLLDLLTLLEEKFEITISDEDLLPENFETITRIAAFVQSKSNGHLKV